MLGSAESEMLRLINRELFAKNSNVYDHDTSTSQTDGRTDRQTTCLGNTALGVASCGKKRKKRNPKFEVSDFTDTDFSLRGICTTAQKQCSLCSINQSINVIMALVVA